MVLKQFAVPRASLLGLQSLPWGLATPLCYCHFGDTINHHWPVMFLGTISPRGHGEQCPLCRPTQTALSPALMLCRVHKLWIHPLLRKKWAHDHFSALTPEKKGGTSLWSLCTALYSCALVYGVFSITPDLSVIRSERGCRKVEASGLGLSQSGIYAGLGRRSCRMWPHDDAQSHLGAPISF